VLHHDARNVAVAIQAICEIGDAWALDEAVSNTFSGIEMLIDVQYFLDKLNAR